MSQKSIGLKDWGLELDDIKGPFQPKPAWFYEARDTDNYYCPREDTWSSRNPRAAHPSGFCTGTGVWGWFCWHMQEVSTLPINAKSTWRFMDVIPNMLTELPLDHYEFCTSCAFCKINHLKCFPVMQFLKIHLAVWTSTSANNKHHCLELRRSYKPLPSMN